MNARLKLSVLSFSVVLSGCLATSPTAQNFSPDQPITFLKHGIYSTNSVNGVSYYIKVVNTSPKELKYLDFTLRPFNRVGDVQKDSISGRSDFAVQSVGPLAPGKTDDGRWGPIWYNSTISCVRVVGVKLTYMDGVVEVLDERKLAQSLGQYNVCMSNV